jgi:hypothetical protein
MPISDLFEPRNSKELQRYIWHSIRRRFVGTDFYQARALILAAIMIEEARGGGGFYGSVPEGSV